MFGVPLPRERRWETDLPGAVESCLRRGTTSCATRHHTSDYFRPTPPQRVDLCGGGCYRTSCRAIHSLTLLAELQSVSWHPVGLGTFTTCGRVQPDVVLIDGYFHCAR